MESLKHYITERIRLNHLPLDVDKCLAVIETYKTLYANASEIERFFLFIKNKVGEHLSLINEDMSEILGWLHVHKSKHDIVYLLFETEEDYYNWLNVRKELYAKLDDIDCIRLLNFLELSTMDFISDITTNCTYKLIDGDDEKYFIKTGYGVDVDSSISFIKYIGEAFKNNITFKPINAL